MKGLQLKKKNPVEVNSRDFCVFEVSLNDVFIKKKEDHIIDNTHS